MPSKTANRVLNFRAPSKEYKPPSHGYILGRVVEAKAMAAGVRELAEDAKEKNQLSTDGFDHMVSLFTSQHELNIPAAQRYVNFDAKSAKAPDIIFRVLGMLSTEPRSQYVFPQGVDRNDADGDTIEAHLNALDPWLFRKYQIRYDIQALFWQLLFGTSYIQQSHLENYWDKEIRTREKEEGDEEFNARISGYKGYAGPPVFRESIDPRIVYPIPTAQGNRAYIKIYTVQRYQLADAFQGIDKGVVWKQDGTFDHLTDLETAAGQEFPLQSEMSNSNVEYYEYVDDSYVYYIVGDRVVHEFHHKGGIKICPAYGLQTGFKEPHLAAVGILWAVRNELPQLDFLRTLWMQKAYLEVFPQLLAQLSDKDQPLLDEKGNPTVWDLEPGTIKQIRGKLVNALNDASSGTDFRAIVDLFAGDIDLATIPSLARGVAGAQQPGYSINQLTQTMRTMWKPIIQSRELQKAQLDEHYLHMIKSNIMEDTSVFAELEDQDTGRRRGDYLTIKPEMIHSYFQVIAHLEPELPIDKQGNRLTWWKLFQEGGATWEEYTREGMDKTNPIARRKDVERDQMRRGFLEHAMKDAMALGQVKLTSAVAEAAGLGNLNRIGSIDAQALKEARARQGQGAEDVEAAAGPPSTGGPQGPGQPGSGIEPTKGANPVNSAPASRR